MRSLTLLFFVACLAVPAIAGQLSGNTFVGERFGRIEIVETDAQWLILDREYSGNNLLGGPVADIKATRPVAGYFPTVHLSAFKRADATVTPDFVLQTSRDAVRQKGGHPGGIQSAAVNGRNVWFFEAMVLQQDKPAKLYYVLLEGDSVFFALQTVVPEFAFDETRGRVDKLLNGISY